MTSSLVPNGNRQAARAPAIQVICLGSGGGPSEDNVSGFLVRSTSSGWIRNSLLAVDAGSHLAAITRILEKDLPAVSRSNIRADSDGNLFRQPQSPRRDLSSSPPPVPDQEQPTLDPIVLATGPFAGFPLPHASARANAAHIVRSHVATYLISHPHLDHLAGFAINTAAFHATSRPKTLAALPFTVDAIKRHIFNDVIWPNLTDEDGGVGFVTFQRLKEGGDIMVGEGGGRGYIEVCEGLGAKGFKISHGKCMRPGNPSESHRGSLGSLSDVPQGYSLTPKYTENRHHSFGHMHLPGTPGSFQSPPPAATSHPFSSDSNSMAVDSTAYFIRDTATSRELLMFGDVEPDSISVAPRLARVWTEAAPKIASGVLTGIFIECSYPDSQGDAVLFGHLAPRHLIMELHTLADMVREEKSLKASERALRKRKRVNGHLVVSQDDSLEKKRTRSWVETELRRASVPDAATETDTRPVLHSSLSDNRSASEVPRLSAKSTPILRPSGSEADGMSSVAAAPLEGLRVIVMHIKDTMKDGPHVSELILEQLTQHAADMSRRGLHLGCEFQISESGKDYWF